MTRIAMLGFALALLALAAGPASPDFSKGWVHRDPGFEKIVLRERFVSEAGEPDADRV